MLQTTNYSLNKPEATDVVDISKLNDNFDTIDTQLKSVSDKANYIQTAGGTGTAITLSNVTLSNGFTVTFVAAYNNSGAATAINGKALYKAGTTAAPTLIAGKAYTVWYNGTNFFIKASAEGTATAGDVLAGKTFSSDTDTGLSGTMTDNGAVSQSLGINGTYTIPAGYHNGSGKITQSVTTKTAATYSPSTSAQTISAGQYLSGDQTIAATTGTAAAAEVLSGKTFNSANGIGLAGTMTNNGAVSQSLGINGTYTIPAGYHNGSGKVTQSVTTKTAATYSPSTSAQTISTGQYLSGDQTIAATTGTAAAADVLSGKTFNSANGIGLTGTISSKAAASYTPGTSDQTIAAGQYLSGVQTVKGDANLLTNNIKSGVSIFGVSGKASVVDTSDASAAASQILSGSTAYVNGSKITGTIASKAATTYTPGTADQTIAAGQYLSGAQTIKGDANLVAGNIAVGKSIFGVAGIMDPRLYDFPLSIQDTQPTAVKSGHIWVKSSTLASSITTVKILEAVNAGEADGTLMLVVGNLALRQMSVTHSKSLTAGGNAIGFSVADNTDNTTDWTVSSLSSGVTTLIKLHSPIAYSKVGGILNIETAYMYNGSSWVLLSQTGTYAITFGTSGGSNSTYIYNRAGDTFTLNTTLTLPYNTSRNLISRDGTYLMNSNTVYKRSGDIFASYFVIPSTYVNGSYTGNIGYAAISPDSKRLIVPYGYNVSSSVYYFCVTYINNGTSFVVEYVTPTIYGGSNGYIIPGVDAVSYSGAYFVMLHAINGNVYHTYHYLKSGVYYTGLGFSATSPSTLFYINSIFSYDDNYFLLLYANTITNAYYLRRYIINPADNLSSCTDLNIGYAYTGAIAIHPGGYAFCGATTSPKVIQISTLSEYTLSGTIAYYYGLSFSADGTRMLGFLNTTDGYYSVAISGTTVTVALISTRTTVSISNTALIPG